MDFDVIIYYALNFFLGLYLIHYFCNFGISIILSFLSGVLVGVVIFLILSSLCFAFFLLRGVLLVSPAYLTVLDHFFQEIPILRPAVEQLLFYSRVGT
jgi:hypothetical protein